MRDFKWFRRIHPYLLVGGLLVFTVIFVALFAPALTKYDPINVRPQYRLLSPSEQHPMGTDEFGRDIMSRIFYGARVSVQIGFTVMLITTLIGTFLGLVAGYYARLDNLIMRIIDGIMAFPEIIIAISLAAIWGSGQLNIILALSFAYFTTIARVARGSVISVKNSEYVDAARAGGARDSYVLFRHILPNCLSPIIVQATFVFAQAILAEATLSFLGVGIQEPTPSWGDMISAGRAYMVVAPWEVLCPGLAIVLTVIGFNLLGDGLRDILDPHLRK